MLDGIRICDAHVHISEQSGIDGLACFLSATGTEMANIVTVPHSRAVTLTPAALVMKRRFPGRFRVFSALDASAYFLHPDDLGEYMASCVKALRAMGCDGVKMLEGKPQMRKLLPVPDFDADVWEPFWACAERDDLPILMHINDPESFWSPDAPEWARAQGWFYDESYVDNEAQYTQILNVLGRHPALKIIFAHFFFMSAQLERLGGIMDSFPNIMVDLTPGIEMYENFSAAPDAAAAFFERFAGRIIYGTDIGGRCVLNGQGKPFNPRENRRRPEIVRRFLTMDGGETVGSDGDFLIKRAPFTMRGPALKGERLAAVLGGNFLRFAGDAAEVDGGAVLAECRRLRGVFAEMSAKYPGFVPDTRCVELAEKYFAGVD